ncbi:hypothetical protein ACGFY8_04835 [Streptomyces sp. NPDC048232]|uniref:hypothetical protein n=1 Tax=Streptomyces sp. NPDC048232 TaxID=3365520 RepID=UPI00371B1D89
MRRVAQVVHVRPEKVDEYHGADLAADLALTVADPATREWWRRTAPCRHPVEVVAHGEWWTSTTRIVLME